MKGGGGMKKDETRFTIRFCPVDPRHRLAVEALNAAGRRKASLIAEAVCRYLAQHGDYKDTAALRIEISENEMREPFTFSENMDFAALFEEIEVAKAKERMLSGKKIEVDDPRAARPKGMNSKSAFSVGKSRDAIGEKIGMSGRTYERARYIQNNAPDEMISRLDNGETSIQGIQ